MPFQTPYGYQADPLAPAKRASVLMIVMGSLFLMCGLCFTGFGFLYDRFPPESRQQFQQLESQLHGLSFKTLFIVLGLSTLVPGALLVIMGVFVRGGGTVAVILSIILCSLFILGSVFLI